MHAYLTLLGGCAARILTIKIIDSAKPMKESVLTALSEHHAPCKCQSQYFQDQMPTFSLPYSSLLPFLVMWKLVNLPHQLPQQLLLFSLFFSVLTPRLLSFSSSLNKTFPCCRKEREDCLLQGWGGCWWQGLCSTTALVPWASGRALKRCVLPHCYQNNQMGRLSTMGKGWEWHGLVSLLCFLFSSVPSSSVPSAKHQHWGDAL